MWTCLGIRISSLNSWWRKRSLTFIFISLQILYQCPLACQVVNSTCAQLLEGMNLRLCDIWCNNTTTVCIHTQFWTWIVWWWTDLMIRRIPLLLQLKKLKIKSCFDNELENHLKWSRNFCLYTCSTTYEIHGLRQSSSFWNANNIYPLMWLRGLSGIMYV